MRGIESERVHKKMADLEARRGPLVGLKEIAADPDYLAEWRARSESRPEPALTSLPGPGATEPPSGETIPVDLVVPVPDLDGSTWEPLEDEVVTGETDEPLPGSELSSGSDQPAAGIVFLEDSRPKVRIMSERSPREVLWRHVAPDEDDRAFLPCLRRGEAVPSEKVAELEGALGQLELELRGAEVLDRSLVHALHRLALESQVLLTDAWPGVFDEPVIAAIRSVQEAVERILSGQDIRYTPSPSGPSSERPR
jgi:hypothetical protein